jgi:hypothetical protein
MESLRFRRPASDRGQGGIMSEPTAAEIACAAAKIIAEYGDRIKEAIDDLKPHVMGKIVPADGRVTLKAFVVARIWERNGRLWVSGPILTASGKPHKTHSESACPGTPGFKIMDAPK